MLLIFDWIPASFWTSHALMLSSMVEVIFISWAMADRVAQTHKEKDKAIQLMQKADHERLEVLRESESRLADEVSRKTRQLQQSLSREMTRHQQFKKLTEMVSHEFRNPLYVMLGRIDLIEKMVSSIGLIKIEDIMPHVTVIKNNGKKIEALLDQWNQQDGVKELFFVPKLEKKEVSTMLKSICIDAERLFPDHCIEFCNVTARVECMVDAELLRIVIFNLIQNACKYSENNTSVQISLTTNAIECEIRVCDEGCGIASDEQSLIFDEYYRSPQHHSKQHGQGLGLVLVKHIVEGHNGRIQVQSEVGKGSCFSVFLQIVSGLK
jgi:two-component system phosphate regulon sensor histidine kinase PhoR